MSHWIWIALSALLAGAVFVVCGTGGGRLPATAAQATGQEAPTRVGRSILGTPYISAPALGGGFFGAGSYDDRANDGDDAKGHGVFVAHLDAAGRPLWSIHLASDQTAVVAGLERAPVGGCLATGWYSGTLSSVEAKTPVDLSGNAGAEMFLVAIASDGRRLWTATTTTTGEDAYATGDLVAGLGDGSCIVVGNVKGRAIFGSGSAKSSAVDSPDKEHGFIAKYSSGGHFEWVRRLAGRVDVERGTDLAVSKHGRVVVAGALKGPCGMFVSSYTESGANGWTCSARGGGAIGAGGVAIARDGSCMLTGWFMGRVGLESLGSRLDLRARGTMDLFVASFDPLGRLRWLCTAGGEGDAYAEGQRVEEQADGIFKVEGTFGGVVRIEDSAGSSQTLLSEDVHTSFVASFESDGRLISTEVR